MYILTEVTDNINRSVRIFVRRTRVKYDSFITMYEYEEFELSSARSGDSYSKFALIFTKTKDFA